MDDDDPRPLFEPSSDDRESDIRRDIHHGKWVIIPDLGMAQFDEDEGQ